MKDRAISREVWLALLYLGLGVASALLWARIMRYETMVLAPGEPSRLESWHQEMISGRAPAPNQYRILVPWMAEGLSRVIPGWMADLACPPIPSQYLIASYWVIRALCLWLSLLVMDRYLREWFSPGAAAGGALCLGALVPFTYYGVVQESDLLNLLVFVAAFWALARGKDGWLFPLVLVGTLNRETAAMIPAVYLLARWREKPPLTVMVRTALLAACWAAVYGGLLLHYGRRGYYTEPFTLPANLGSWLPTAFVLLMFGVMWVLPWVALKHKPPTLLRRTTWLVPLFVLLQYLVGVVQEVRLFLPLAPIVLPLSWWVLFPESRRAAPAVSGRTPKR